MARRMGGVRAVLARLRGRHADPARDDFDEEIRQHLDLLVDRFIKAGLPQAEAERAARRQFGNLLHLHEDRRALQSAVPLLVAHSVRDLRHGLRALRRAPVFTAVAVLTFALGIGANTAILSIVNGVLLRPLAYPHPGQLMYLDAPGTGAAQFELSVPEYLEFRRFTASFRAVGAFRLDEANMAAADRAVRVRTAVVDASLMQALGVQPLQGRLFSKDETDRPNAPPVVVLSYGLWQSAFGGQAIVGDQVDLDGRRAEVIGILPAATDLMDAHPEIWLPLSFLPEELLARSNHNLRVIGRLTDGVTPQAAQTELRALVQAWAARANVPPGASGHAGHVFLTPKPDGTGHYLRMTPLAERILGRASRSIWALQAAVGLVLLIACANVTNLLLARGESRQRELALLVALGASRGAIVRKALTESVLLALAGCGLGVGLARVGLQTVIRAYPESLPRIGDVALDTRVLVVSIAVAIVCGVLFGLAPVWQMRAATTATTLKSVARGSSDGRHRVRGALVVAETALAIVVAIGAGLLLRTTRNLMAVDPGFRPEQRVTFAITLPLQVHNARTRNVGIASAARSRTYQRIVDHLRSVPGILDASAITLLPLDRSVNGSNTEVAGAPSQIGIDYPRVLSNFFETMGIPIVQGRSFEPADVTAGGWVTVVNEALAKSVWRDRSPIGQRLRPAGTKDAWFTVIGVAKNVKQATLDRDAEPEAYILIDQFVTDNPTTWVGFSPATLHMVVKTTWPLSTAVSAIRSAIHDIDPTVAVTDVRPMEDVVARSIERPRLLAELLMMFAGLALVLAAIGIYGVLAYVVAARRREMGIRLALGATGGRVFRQVLRQGLVLAGGGVVAGALAAIGLTRWLSTMLFGVQPADPMTLIVAMAATIVIAGAACALPAWRAAHVDPNVVLGAE